jgi:hypothetical protein
MKQYEGIKHTDDQHDSFFLAQMLILGILPEGYIYPKEDRPVRDLARSGYFWCVIGLLTSSVCNP